MAWQWYLNWEFESGVSDPFHLLLLMKDIKALVGKARAIEGLPSFTRRPILTGTR